MLKIKSRTYDSKRVPGGNGQNISTRDDTRADFFDSGFDVVNNFKSSGGIEIWLCPLFACEG